MRLGTSFLTSAGKTFLDFLVMPIKCYAVCPHDRVASFFLPCGRPFLVERTAPSSPSKRSGDLRSLMGDPVPVPGMRPAPPSLASLSNPSYSLSSARSASAMAYCNATCIISISVCNTLCIAHPLIVRSNNRDREHDRRDPMFHARISPVQTRPGQW